MYNLKSYLTKEVLFTALWSLLVVHAMEDVADIREDSIKMTNKLLQPCKPYDSCERRCVKDSINPTTKINVTLGHFNCFCDPNCEIFGDCCFNYKSQCVHPQQKPKPKLERGILNQEISDFELPERDKSFECVVVDQFSKGSYWMVTKCADNWNNDAVRKKCLNKEKADFESNLPVLGDTGWTYRNIFCAQCNNIKKYYYWAMKAQCVRSAPPEVLSGDPEMISYYLNHFCSIEVQQDIKPKKDDQFFDVASKGDMRKMLAWKMSLRSCERRMIDKCPDLYQNTTLSRLCESYQSIVIAEADDNNKIIFKNPMCAFCHGYSLHSLERPNNQPKSNLNEDDDESDETLKNADLLCPLWMLTKYYDTMFWLLDVSTKSAELLPAFSKNYKTSNWSPPSFSVLMRFHENGKAEITYVDGTSPIVSIPQQQMCNEGQIYDPFYGICRLVMCANDMIFTNGGCVQSPAGSSDADLHVTLSPMPVAATVTVSIVIPVSQHTNTSDVNEISDSVVEAFENVLNKSVESVTVENKTTCVNCSYEKQYRGEDVLDDGVIDVTISFVVLEYGNYTEEDIVQVVEQISNMVNFDKILMEVDMYSVLVVDQSTPKIILHCSDGAEKTLYNSSEYELNSFDGKNMLYINTTDSYYVENEFQLLDWVITFNENGTEYGYLEESRVLACVENGSIAVTGPVCNIYIPLNTSEYIINENGSMWLYEREMIIPPDEYISFNGGYAVCVDGYTFPPEPKFEEPTIDPTVLIINWVTFGVTIFSLTCLGFTFITYCLFSELRSIAGWNIMNLTVALFAAMLTFLVGANWTDSPVTCTAITMLLHYLFLSTFFWNNVMAFDVWLTFGKGIKQTFRRSLFNNNRTIGRASFVRRLVLKYMIYGWGMPGVVVAICAAIEFGNPDIHFGYRYDPKFSVCWISNPMSNVIAFGVPLALILIVNAMFFATSIVAIRRVTARKRRHSSTASIASKRRKSSAQTPASPKGKIIKTTQSATPDNDNVFTFPEIAREKNESTKAHLKPNTQNKKTTRGRPSTTSTKSYNMSLGLARINVLLYVKMSTVMGFVWAVGFAAVFAETEALWYIFEISVPLQGIFILIAFICKRRIFELFKQLCKTKKTKTRLGSGNVKIRLQLPEYVANNSHKNIPARSSLGNLQVNNLPTGISAELDDTSHRSRMYSSSSCESMHSHDKWLQSPGFNRKPSVILDHDGAGFVNKSYNAKGDTFSESINDEHHMHDIMEDNHL